MDKISILGEFYPINDLLEQNDILPEVVIRWLVDEGLIDLDDYFDSDDELMGVED